MTPADENLRFRLTALHSLFLNEFDRNAHDGCVRLLKQIAKETAKSRISPEATFATIDPTVRGVYWRQLLARAEKIGSFERRVEVLEAMRRDDARAVPA